MQTGKGVFIVIEGTDGSGKGTQFQHLAKRLTAEGYDVATFDFPQYEQESSYFVREYLNGRYGSAEDVGPYTGSLFYALDRYQAAPNIRQALEEGKVVLANRYVGSNMAHQGTKFQQAEERRGYFIWLDNLEFEMLRSPRPTLSFVLRVPAETAQKLVDKKAARSYTDKKRDLHEADLSHLERAVNVYDEMCQLFPRDFSRIDCVRDGLLLDIDTVHDIIWQKVQPMLPPRPHSGPGTISHRTANAAENETSHQKIARDPVLTETGKQLLDAFVTNEQDNVYLFTEQLAPQRIAELFAALVTQGKAIRPVLAKTKANQDETDQTSQKKDKINEKISATPHSTWTSTYSVIEDTSQLLASHVQRGRLAAYANQPLHTCNFDRKDTSGKYRYYAPKHLHPAIDEQYHTHMDTLFDLYSKVVQGLSTYLHDTSDLPKAERDAVWRATVKRQAHETARVLLPLAATSSIGMYASGEALEHLVRRLLGDSLPEARKTIEALLPEIKKIDPDFLDRLNRTESGAAITYRASNRQKVGKLARTHLPGSHPDLAQPVQLTDVTPRSELAIVADMLYPHSNLSLKDLQERTAQWPYTQKLAIFEAYLGERSGPRQYPGRALEKMQYSWDVVSDFAVFRDIQQYHLVNNFEWQEITPRLGYEIPKLIEAANLAGEFESAFDLSLRLHSILYEAGHHLEAQYAALLGHKMRWAITFNAREAFRILEGLPGAATHPDTQKLLRQLHSRLAEVHPLLGDAIQFVGSK